MSSIYPRDSVRNLTLLCRDVCPKNVPPLSGLVRHLDQYWCSHDGLTQQVLVLVHHVSTGTSQHPTKHAVISLPRDDPQRSRAKLSCLNDHSLSPDRAMCKGYLWHVPCS